MDKLNTFQPGLLRNKAAFITGGGSGINRQIALTYALAGAAVTIVGRSLEKASHAAAEIEAAGGHAIGLSADVRNYEAMGSAVEHAYAAFGPIDIVVAGAAGNFVAPATGMSSNGFRAVIETDLVGTFNTLRAAHDFLRKPSALVLAISAVQSSMPTYAQAHVCAAKAGVDMLIRSLAVEWADEGIRCVGIAPGPVTDTEGMARLAPEGQESWARLLQSIPSGRGASRQEIADLALYLASDSGRYINGVVIPIDGGFSAVGSLEFGRMLKDSVTPTARAAR
ncbi:SDR family oxidoreductase [Hydrogenophaga sp.]|uniref:SDR family oxidoreductase n=1 Tax=Hydrogenophaga sp. TaxID=1904254 RepID=UPI0025BE6993|nr:SDR family oxidoreductase [Hydrogenophaga sp.]MBT9465631.1 SDR family oxidoreductase [Hydrogenophaga sp.]